MADLDTLKGRLDALHKAGMLEVKPCAEAVFDQILTEFEDLHAWCANIQTVIDAQTAVIQEMQVKNES